MMHKPGTISKLMFLKYNTWWGISHDRSLYFLSFWVHNHDWPVLNGANVQVNKPGERVLVHGVYVGQISNGEEQRSWVIGNRPVTFPWLCNLDLCDLCNLENRQKVGRSLIYSDLDFSSRVELFKMFGMVSVHILNKFLNVCGLISLFNGFLNYLKA